MDPITQFALGASLGLAFKSKASRATVALVAGLGGMAPDLDVLIRSSTNPLLNLEYHRHFTHSLAFIPFGGILTGICLFPLLKKWISIKESLIFATIGLATHGLLDACTSYGTQLLWPFSNQRVAWDIVSIVDPIYTLILILAIIFCIRKACHKPAIIGLVLSCLYLLFGFYQHEQAMTLQRQLARSRQHSITRGVVRPSFANLMLWRSTYEHNGSYFVDAVWVFPFVSSKIYTGQRVQKYSLPLGLKNDSRLAQDINKFKWFSDDWLYESASGFVSDLRYSAVPNETKPLWIIQVDSTKPMQHVPFNMSRNITATDRQRFLNMLLKRNIAR